MERLKNWLVELANRQDIKTTNSKIEQKTRNALKNEFTNLLVEAFTKGLDDPSIIVVRTAKGVGIALDNEKLGFIPIEINSMFKDLENDIEDMSAEYVEHLKAKEEKAKEQAELKARKIAKQQEIRKKKAELKKLQEESAEPEPQDLVLDTESDDLE